MERFVIFTVYREAIEEAQHIYERTKDPLIKEELSNMIEWQNIQMNSDHPAMPYIRKYFNLKMMRK